LSRRAGWWRAALLLPGLGASGCGGLIDADEARLCRLALPAIHPDASAISIVSSERAAPPYSVSIAYRATEAGATREHRVFCGFVAGSPGSASISLDRFATETGPYSPMKVHILNRYWLQRPELSGLADPGAGTTLPPIRLPVAPAYLVQAFANALPSTAMTMMIGVAYALIYGLVGRINLAFGALAMVGGYGAVAGATLATGLGLGGTTAGLSFAAAGSLILAALWGYATERTVFAPLVDTSGQSVLVATLALSIVMQEFFRLAEGAEERWIAPILSLPIPIAGSADFIASVTVMQVIVAILAGTAALFVVGVMRWSEFGRKWKAVADDRLMASLMGISSAAILAEAFVLASLLAGVGGFVMVAYYGGASFASGTLIGLKGLVAAIVGGIGSVEGALLGGLAVGVFEAFWSAYLPIEHKDLAVLLLLVVVFVLKPGGLLGFPDATPRSI
jgi:branched-chain amino acid transport system permease protein